MKILENGFKKLQNRTESNPGDSGRFSTAMSALVRVSSSFFSLPVKSTTTTHLFFIVPTIKDPDSKLSTSPKNYVFNTKAVITPPILISKVPAHVNNIFSILSI